MCDCRLKIPETTVGFILCTCLCSEVKTFLDMDNRDQRQARSKAGARKPLGFKIICTSKQETLTYNKGADQPAHPHSLIRERSGSVVECLTRDRRAAGSSLTGVTALCPWVRTLILA